MQMALEKKQLVRCPAAPVTLLGPLWLPPACGKSVAYAHITNSDPGA